MPFEINQRVKRGGFVTPLLSVINQSAGELERRIGYASGRMAKGWALLFLKENVEGHEFRYAGYSHFSGGRIGHPRGGDARTRVEDDLAKLVGSVADMRAKGAARIFQLTGPNRIVKLIPTADENADLETHENYPVGTGIPQFILTEQKWFVVGAIVGAGMVHLGGGVDGPLPTGFWINPERAKTL